MTVTVGGEALLPVAPTITAAAPAATAFATWVLRAAVFAPWSSSTILPAVPAGKASSGGALAPA